MTMLSKVPIGRAFVNEWEPTKRCAVGMGAASHHTMPGAPSRRPAAAGDPSFKGGAWSADREIRLACLARVSCEATEGMANVEPDRLAVFRAGYDRFMQFRARLVDEGVPPALASALANLGFDSLAALQHEVWGGPGGLGVRLSQRRLVGPVQLKAWRNGAIDQFGDGSSWAAQWPCDFGTRERRCGRRRPFFRGRGLPQARRCAL
jgi:hypothetical protein